LGEHPLGLILYAPVDVVLSLHDVAQPDLVFISQERLRVFTEKNIQGAPDLAIEILSKSTRQQDEGIKLERYGRLGVREYWIFDPDRNTARVFRREGGRLQLAAELSAKAGDILTSRLFPGLEIALAEVFA
ncbi:MAG TPA: Uma2 family endonuclease, partial [Thermoanaerobaculia bacterium]|nr:Uma2 family endonuclease [Thermoanaerobaculia bacterium]